MTSAAQAAGVFFQLECWASRHPEGNGGSTHQSSSLLPRGASCGDFFFRRQRRIDRTIPLRIDFIAPVKSGTMMRKNNTTGNHVGYND